MVFCVWFLLVVNTSASDYLERLVPEMIKRDVKLYSLTYSLTFDVLCCMVVHKNQIQVDVIETVKSSGLNQVMRNEGERKLRSRLTDPRSPLYGVLNLI